MSASLHRYKKLLLTISIIALLVTGITWLWYQRQAKLDKIAQDELFKAVYYFEEGSYDKALEGDDNFPGFITILTNYKYTPTANLAYFYAGICCIYQERYEEARKYLTHFKSKDGIFQARTWSLIGDAFVQEKNYEEAVTYYLKAANYRPNQFFSPSYLIKAALAYEAKQAYPAAIACYQAIVKKYDKSSYKVQAEKEMNRLEALL